MELNLVNRHGLGVWLEKREFGSSAGPVSPSCPGVDSTVSSMVPTDIYRHYCTEEFFLRDKIGKHNLLKDCLAPAKRTEDTTRAGKWENLKVALL